MSSSEAKPDFGALDFQALWKGREKVTAVESEILRSALRIADPARAIEIGVGGGRLAPVVQEHAQEYLAADVTREFLERVPLSPGVAGFRVGANVLRLPVVDAAFRSAVMVRVYGFLAEPVAALREIFRILAPGGHLVVSYSPRPSIETLVSDLKVAGAGPKDRFRSMTFSRDSVVPVRPSSFPAWSSTRTRFAETAMNAGFERVQEWPSGLEDYRFLRRLPTRVFCSMARSFSAVGGFPTRFALLRKPGTAPESLPAWERILACPACRAPWTLDMRWSGGGGVACPSCHREWAVSNGILDARWSGAHPGP